MIASEADIFTARARFDVADVAPFVEAVPAKAAVALFLNRDGQPLQLICTKNLRAMLRRRLGSPDAEEVAPAGKRVDYRSLVGEVAWRRVDSDFEMDIVYIEAARQAFPAQWRRLIPDRSAHFVAIELAHDHPDFIRISDPAASKGAAVFGPFPDKAKADRWIETARDAFDLCRYRTILAQAPDGRACAYKQMNKCPAPCDGTVEMGIYRNGVSRAVQAIRSPAAFIDELSAAMKQHAGRLEFEQAGKVKTRLTTFGQLAEGPYRGVRPIEAFDFVSIQPGPRRNTAKIFVLTASALGEIAAVTDPALTLDDLQDRLGRPTPTSAWPSDVRLGLACYHLASPKAGHRFVARQQLTPDAFATMLADAMKPRVSKEDSGEAVRETRIEA